MISGAIPRGSPFPMGAAENLVLLRLTRRHGWRENGEVLSGGVCFGPRGDGDVFRVDRREEIGRGL